VVGSGGLQDLDSHLQRAGLSGPFLVVSQPRIFKAVGTSLRKRFPIELIPEGERAKSLGTVTRILQRFAKMKMTRQSTVVALGGGVVGDVTGFAASMYMRGISVVQAPTTLLAQVDSSIGGKTGINFRTIKNLVGAFHQPRLVLTDIDTLTTLPAREYCSGLYEALKYGIICDRDLFDWFGVELKHILDRSPEHMERLVARCAAIKADVVTRDEREGDLRRVLNLGHTVGHGLEAAAGFRKLKHGEAVGYGMIAAVRISKAMGRMSSTDVEQAESTIRGIGALPQLADLKVKSVMEAMQHDKKVRDGAVHFVLPIAIGRVEITRQVPLELVQQTVKTLIDENKIRRTR
jgi:3-dehydroquinate synthase